MQRHTGKMKADTQRPKLRLYVAADLVAGATVVPTPEQAHYLSHVMRLTAGAPVALFNGRDGEWLATLEANRRAVLLKVMERLRAQQPMPERWLLFAPIKRTRIDLVAEKASELGATVLQPVLTERTVVDRVNLDRLTAHAVEAAEQCGRLSVPEIRPLLTLDRLFDGWSGPPVWLARPGALPALAAPAAGAVLIGPEGGFSPAEERWLGALPFVTPVGLGPLVLRAETAAIVALALLQARHGARAETANQASG